MSAGASVDQQLARTLCVVGDLPQSLSREQPALDAAWRRLAGRRRDDVGEALLVDESGTRRLLVVDAVEDAAGMREAGRKLGERLDDDEVEVATAAELGTSELSALAEGIAVGAYAAGRPGGSGVPRVRLPAADVAARATVVARAINTARDLTLRTPSDLTPQALVDAAREVAARHARLELEAIDADRLRAEGFDGLSGVGSGSVHPPALVELRHRPRPGAPAVAVIGKGVTFDSGGLQLKAKNLEWMKMDMAGAAAALMALDAACAMGLDVNVDVILPIAENLPGPNAIRPGDVIRQLDGSTTEVAHTDAEGRLMLADAITYARRGDPVAIVDIATLTDPFALGDEMLGVCANDDGLAGELLAAASDAGEPAWRLPLWRGYRPWLDSSVADRRNWAWDRTVDGIPLAGTILGGLFLEQFAGHIPWAHVDIAATTIHRTASGPWPAGASGAGVATLIRWLEARA